jgi:DnaJ-class molecular chaperone
MTTASDYYGILGVPRNATPAQIKSAFRSKAMRYHPDHNRGVENWAGKKLQAVVEAYEVLGDPVSRAVYDRRLARGGEYVYSQEVHYQPKTTREHMVDLMRSGYVPFTARLAAFGWVFMDNFYREVNKGGTGK